MQILKIGIALFGLVVALIYANFMGKKKVVADDKRGFLEMFLTFLRRTQSLMKAV